MNDKYKVYDIDSDDDIEYIIIENKNRPMKDIEYITPVELYDKLIIKYRDLDSNILRDNDNRYEKYIRVIDEIKIDKDLENIPTYEYINPYGLDEKELNEQLSKYDKVKVNDYGH